MAPQPPIAQAGPILIARPAAVVRGGAREWPRRAALRSVQRGLGGTLVWSLLLSPAAQALPPGQLPAHGMGAPAATLGGVIGLQEEVSRTTIPAAPAPFSRRLSAAADRAGMTAPKAAAAIEPGRARQQASLLSTPTPRAEVDHTEATGAVAATNPLEVLVPDGSFREADPPPLRPGAPSGPTPSAEPEGTASRQLVLHRRKRQLLVLENGTPLRRFPVAVGMPGWETPVGRFRILEKQVNPVWEHPATGLRIQPGPDNPLGSRWIGFYRDCRGRSGFNGKEHLVVKGCVVAGFHGTPNRSSVGRAVSHGCVRLFDEDVRDLFDLVQVGTTVTVLP